MYTEFNKSQNTFLEIVQKRFCTPVMSNEIRPFVSERQLCLFDSEAPLEVNFIFGFYKTNYVRTPVRIHNGTIVQIKTNVMRMAIYA